MKQQLTLWIRFISMKQSIRPDCLRLVGIRPVSWHKINSTIAICTSVLEWRMEKTFSAQDTKLLFQYLW